MRIALTTIAALLGILTGAASAQTLFNVVYPSTGTQIGRNSLDVYIARNPLPDRPTVIVLYGGGYVSGSKADVAGVCQELAERGFNAVAPNYSLATPTVATSPQAMRDTLNVVRWVRASGGALGLDPKVVLTGFSAGSTIAVAAAMGSTAPIFADPALPAADTSVDLAVGFFGRYDMVWNLPYGLPGYVYQFVGAGPGSAGLTAALAVPSAVSYVGQCSPPTALYHGGSDGTVPVQNSLRLFTLLQSAQVPSTLAIAPYGGHDLGGIGGEEGAAQFIISGVNRLLGTNCTVPAGSPGACCSGLTCVRVFPSDCAGSFAPGQVCSAQVCLPLVDGGSCCVGSACSVRLRGDCTGDFTPGVLCSPTRCAAPMATGGCCWGMCCVPMPIDECVGPNRRCLGPATACVPPGTAGGCCPADFDQNGQRTVDDIFIFLGSWFSGSPAASNSGGTPVIDDIFVYLSNWFGGCD